MGSVIDLNIYPVKGMRAATHNGQPINELFATPVGFELKGISDRQVFAAANSAEGELTVITPRGRDTSEGRESVHIGDRALKAVEVDISGKHQLVLSAPAVGKLAIDLSDFPKGRSERAALHGGLVWGFELGKVANDFVSEVVNRRASLMRTARNHSRVTKGGEVRSTLASDGHPYLLGNLESLDAARRGVTMVRYRPNVVVDELDGKGPFAEHLAKVIAIGSALFTVESGSTRCIVTNLDEMGTMVGGGLNILRPRRGLRVSKNGVVDEGSPEPIFCVNMTERLSTPDQKIPIAKGDAVAVTEWGDSPNMVLASESQEPK